MDDNEFSNKANPGAGLLVLGVVSVISGAVTLGLGNVVFGGELSLLADSWKAAKASNAALYANMTVYAVYLGGAVAAGGFVAIAGGLLKKRAIGIVALFIIIVSGAVQLLAGVMMNPVIVTSRAILEPSSYNANFDANSQGMMDTAHAVFNKCCFELQASDPNIPEIWRNDTQKEILPCPLITDGVGIDDPAVCAPLPDVITTNPLITPENAAKLCTCFQPDSYQPVYKKISQDDLCPSFAEITAPVGTDLEIPVARISVQLALSNTQFADYLPVKDTAMAGPAAPRIPALVDGAIALPSQGEEGFGCGLGYAKGVAWIQNLWLENNIGSLLFVLIGCGAVEILACLMVITLWCLTNGNSGDDQWLQEYDQKADVAPYHP